MHITAYGWVCLAAEALGGPKVGADPAGHRVFLMTSIGAWRLCNLPFFAFVGPVLIDVMTTSAEVRAETRVYLPWMVAAPLVGVLAWMMDGVFIGATRGRDCAT